MAKHNLRGNIVRGIAAGCSIWFMVELIRSYEKAELGMVCVFLSLMVFGLWCFIFGEEFVSSS